MSQPNSPQATSDNQLVVVDDPTTIAATSSVPATRTSMTAATLETLTLRGTGENVIEFIDNMPSGVERIKAIKEVYYQLIDQGLTAAEHAYHLQQWITRRNFCNEVPDPHKRTPEGLQTFMPDDLKNFLVYGKNTSRWRPVLNAKISSFWGENWKERVPKEMRPEHDHYSKHLLVEISKAADAEHDMELVTAEWQTAIDERRSPSKAIKRSAPNRGSVARRKSRRPISMEAVEDNSATTSQAGDDDKVREVSPSSEPANDTGDESQPQVGDGQEPGVVEEEAATAGAGAHSVTNLDADERAASQQLLLAAGANEPDVDEASQSSEACKIQTFVLPVVTTVKDLLLRCGNEETTSEEKWCAKCVAVKKPLAEWTSRVLELLKDVHEIDGKNYKINVEH